MTVITWNQFVNLGWFPIFPIIWLWHYMLLFSRVQPSCTLFYRSVSIAYCALYIDAVYIKTSNSSLNAALALFGSSVLHHFWASCNPCTWSAQPASLAERGPDPCRYRVGWVEGSDLGTSRTGVKYANYSATKWPPWSYGKLLSNSFFLCNGTTPLFSIPTLINQTRSNKSNMCRMV